MCLLLQKGLMLCFVMLLRDLLKILLGAVRSCRLSHCY